MMSAAGITARAEKAFDMLARAELVPIDYWAERGATWLTTDLREFAGLAPPGLWERCETNFHVLTRDLGQPVPLAVAVQILSDDGSHATAWAVCQECLDRMGYSGGPTPR